ncbi:MAG: hypothetical protein WDN69_23840 [Aliidongia sp.]
MMPLFDSYVMVDWSAESRPKRGKDSIWLAHLRRLDDGGWHAAEPVNPPTRAEAARAIETLLDAELAAGRRVLVGFDFPLGYPHGFAARLGLAGVPWRAVWQDYARLLVDDASNANNRFALAETLNRRISGGAFPFWGRPVGADFPMLETRHHRRHETDGLAERRLVDQRVRSSQTVWKLLGIGAAGGQALTGIPVLERAEAALRARRAGLAVRNRACRARRGADHPRRDLSLAVPDRAGSRRGEGRRTDPNYCPAFRRAGYAWGIDGAVCRRPVADRCRAGCSRRRRRLGAGRHECERQKASRPLGGRGRGPRQREGEGGCAG